MANKPDPETQKKIDQLLALLGGKPGVMAADEPAVDTIVPDEEETSSLDKAELQNKEELMKTRSTKFDEAFTDAILPHIYDHENYKPGSLPKLTMYHLKKMKIGLLDAIDYFDEAMSYVITNVEHFVRVVHAGPGARGVNREPIAEMFEPRRSDPNFKALSREREEPFWIEIINEDAGDPFHYTISVEGSGLTKANYKLDASAASLEMLPGHKYKAEITEKKTGGGGTRMRVKIPDAKRGEDHLMIMANQVPTVIMKAVSAWLDKEYTTLKTHSERVELEKAQTKRELDKLKEQLSTTDDPEKEDELRKKIRKREVRYRDLDEIGFGMGEGEGEGPKEEPLFDTPITKRHEKSAPYTRWYDVAPSPGTFDRREVPYQTPGTWMGPPNEDDIDKLNKDLMQSVENEGSLHGFPMKDLVVMMMQAIQRTPGKTLDEKTWRGPFLTLLKDYARTHDVKLPPSETNIYKWVDELVKGVQQKILNDDRFKRLRNNLIREKMRAIQSAEDDSKVPAMIDQAWKSPEEKKIRRLYVEILLMHGLPARIVRDIDAIKTGLGPDAPGSINDVNDIIFELNKKKVSLHHLLDREEAKKQMVGDADKMIPHVQKLLEFTKLKPVNEKMVVDYLLKKSEFPTALPDEYKQSLVTIYNGTKDFTTLLDENTDKNTQTQKGKPPVEDPSAKFADILTYYEDVAKDGPSIDQAIENTHNDLMETEGHYDRLKEIQQYLKTEPNKLPEIEKEFAGQGHSTFDFKGLVYHPTELGFRSILEAGDLRKAFRYLKIVAGVIESEPVYRELAERLKHLFLVDVLREDDLKLKAEMFVEFKDYFRDTSTPKLDVLMGRIKTDLAREFYQAPEKLDELKRKQKVDRTKIDKPESERVLREREPETRKELEDILQGF